MKNNKQTKRIISIFTILFLLISFTCNFQEANASESRKVFDIIEITDFHGALTDASDNQVAAVLADRISKIEKDNHKRTLIIGGGDLYQGSATSNIMKGNPVSEVMSRIGMEVTALGNHEFDWGLNTIIDTTMKNSSYSIVCSNLYNKNTGERVFEPYKIVKKNKIKIAIVGGISNETPSIVLPDNTKDYEFKDMTTEINNCAKEIKDNNLADVVIALVHAGDNGDGKTGEIFDTAEKLENIDAVFGGHSHTKVCTRSKTNNIPIYIGNSNGKGFIDAKFEITDDNKVVFEEPSVKTSYIALDNENGYKAEKVVLNNPVKKIVNKANKEVEPITSEKIGINTDKELTRTQSVSPYGSSVLGNWAADVTREAVNADVGFQNNGGLRINIPVGDITVGTMWRFMPFDNTIYKLNMKKSDIKSLLEQAINDNGKGIQVSGIKFTYDPSRKALDRVTGITREDGSKISDDETLTVAAPDFLATGGDNFTAFVKCGGDNPANDTHIVVRDKFIEWCKANNQKNGNNTIPNECVSRINIASSTDSNTDEDSNSISILATTDVHGSVLNYDYATGKAPSKPQGLAKISTYANQVRSKNKNTMLIDNGDAIQGTPLVYYYNMQDTTSEYPMAKVMGAMKYDSFTLGNHEFNFGLDTLNRIIKDYEKENISVLGGNIYKIDGDSGAKENYVKPYIMKDFNVNGKNVKVAIVGLENKCIPSWEDKEHYKGLEFNDLVEDADKYVKEVREKGADVVIVSAHTGTANGDSSEAEEGALPENQADLIATKVSGIDAIIAGHAHEKVNDTTKKNPEGKVVPIVESTKGATALAQLDINFDKDGNVSGIESKNVVMDDSIEEDSAIVEIVKPYHEKTLEYINTKVGTSLGEFKGEGQLVKATPIMELINKVQKDAAGTDLSIAAPLSSSCYIPKGDITIKNTMSVYVFENYLYGVKMNGRQIKDWLEYSARYYAQVTDENKEVKKDSERSIPDFNLDQLYGATYDIDLTEPACEVDSETGRVISGNRIKNLKINGVFIKDTDEFTVAVNNYRFNGGGNFMKAVGLDSNDPSIVTYDSAKSLGDDGQVRSLMTEYIKKNKVISPDCTNNWSIISKKEEVKKAA